MNKISLDTLKQIQLDNQTHPSNVIIHENGDNYCTYNKSAMQMTCCFREHPFILEYYYIENLDCLIKLTFTSEAFNCIKKKYRVISLPSNQWLVYTKQFVSDYKYHIWSGIISLELRMAQNKMNEMQHLEDNQQMQIAQKKIVI